jgi:hypothetical protein
MQRGQQLSQGRQYAALTDGSEQDPAVIKADFDTVNVGQPRE